MISPCMERMVGKLVMHPLADAIPLMVPAMYCSLTPGRQRRMAAVCIS